MSLLKQVEVDWLFTPDNVEMYIPVSGKVMANIVSNEPEYVNFTVTSSNRAKVGYTGEANEELVIPETFIDTDDGVAYKVTAIENGAFKYCTNLKSVVIPSTITGIGSNAFKDCTNLKSVTILEGVEYIRDMAFYGCTSLTDITIPDGVTWLGEQTFERCSELKTVVIPVSVTNIGSSTFYECNGLTTVYYRGTQDQWSAIEIAGDNDPLTNAAKVYNYTA